MLGKEREHAALGHQMTDQRTRVQKFPIHPFHTLHAMIIKHRARARTQRHADYSAVS
jgi:hypothetical protein